MEILKPWASVQCQAAKYTFLLLNFFFTQDSYFSAKYFAWNFFSLICTTNGGPAITN